MITTWLNRWQREMRESRAHKIRGKTHQNKFPPNIVIWAKTVVRSDDLMDLYGVQHLESTQRRRR